MKVLLMIMPIFLFSKNYMFSDMETKSIKIAQHWMNSNSKIEKKEDGFLNFHYGMNMPSIICNPSYASVIRLEKGEEWINLKSGDPERWGFDVIKDSTEGRTFVLVKPTELNLSTNLIIFTNKRVYSIKLVSSTKWTPLISFTYNDYSKTIKTPPSSNYTIESDGIWKPRKIFTKKSETYILIDNENINNIRLYLMNRDTSDIIKYRYENKYLIVNKIIEKAILVNDGLTKTTINIVKSL